MGSLCNQRLHSCRIQSLLRGPEASSPGYIHIAPERLPMGLLRRCYKYPGAHGCLSIAQFWGRGKENAVIAATFSPHPYQILPSALFFQNSFTFPGLRTILRQTRHRHMCKSPPFPSLQPRKLASWQTACQGLKDEDEFRGGWQDQFKPTGSSSGLHAIRKDSDQLSPDQSRREVLPH